MVYLKKKTEAHSLTPFLSSITLHPPSTFPLFILKKIVLPPHQFKKGLQNLCEMSANSKNASRFLFLSPSIIILMVRPWVLTKVRNELN